MKSNTQETGPDTSQEDLPQTVQKAGFGRWMRSEWIMPVLAVLAATAVFSIPVLHDYVGRIRTAAEDAWMQRSSNAMAEGLKLAAVDESREQAYVTLRHALSSALTPEARQNALLALGEFLLVSARKSPEVYARPAQQYFRLLLAHEVRSGHRLRALAGLLALARQQGDLAGLRSLCAEIHKEEMAADDRVAFLIAQLDSMRACGQWSDINGLLKELLLYEADPRFRAEVTVRWADVHAQVLKRKDYFAMWRKTLPAGSDTASDEELRGRLVTNLLVKVDAIAKGASGRTAEDAKFQLFRLLFNEGRLDEASLLLENLRLHDLGENEREAMLLAIELTRRANHLRVFQDRVLRYVESYGIDAAIEPFYFEMLNLRIASGKGKAVMKILEQKLTLTCDPEPRARLLKYMGDLARRLESDDVAERCYEDILNMPKAENYHPMAMLARCEICADRGQLAEACQWLDRYLIRYPEERAWRDTAGKLLARLRTSPEQGGACLATISMLLRNRLPNDPLTGEFISLVAQQMEALGLSSLAHNYYTRVLLQPVQPGKPTVSGEAQEKPPTDAMLGSARCLLDLNRKLEADRMLRSVCSVSESDKARSEAAILWAGMALERDQKRECERRLGLVDTRQSDTNVIWQVVVNRLLLRLPSATNAWAAAAEVMAVMRGPVAENHPELMRKAYEACFESLVAHQDEAGLRMVFASTNSVMPATMQDEFRLRIARQYLSRQDYATASEWLQRSSMGLTNVVAVINKNNQMLQRYR